MVTIDDVRSMFRAELEGLVREVVQETQTLLHNQLTAVNIVDLRECLETLKGTQEALRDTGQLYSVYAELAKLRGDQKEIVESQKEQLQSKVDELNVQIANMSVRIAMLESALENKKVDV
ncbi:hypothetical protein KC887_01130 [Candidatus Kaiserbacteria bacterium]|nr:hypothetical protein [Candidatus Kaiserbacteria bacterium]